VQETMSRHKSETAHFSAVHILLEKVKTSPTNSKIREGKTRKVHLLQSTLRPKPFEVPWVAKPLLEDVLLGASLNIHPNPGFCWGDLPVESQRTHQERLQPQQFAKRGGGKLTDRVF